MRRIEAVAIFSLVYLLFPLPRAFSQPTKSFSAFSSSSRNNGNASEPKRKTPTTTKRPPTEKELEDILSSQENWSRLESRVKGSVDDLLKSILPIVIRQGSHANLSSECQEAIVRTTFALRQLKGWALKILDASGKPPNGMLVGTISSIGSYQECLSTVAYQDVEERVPLFTGKYCTLLIRPPVFDGIVPRNFDSALREVVTALRKGEIFGSAMKDFGYLARDNAIRWGVCVPSPCSANDVENLSQLVTNIFGMTSHVPRCEVQEKTVLKESQKAVFFFFGVLGGMVLLGTLLKQALPLPNTKPSTACSNCLNVFRSFFECFCVRSNLDKVFASNPTSSIGCLHGIRCLTMMWIIYGHTYFYHRNTQTFSSLLNGYDGIVNNFYFTPIINFTFSVETFFFISGLLVVYSNWPQLQRTNGRMNIFVFLLRRYWRLTPLLSVIVCLAIILPLLGSGPLWYEFVQTEAENCEQRWWMNILYFNNLMPYHNTCMVATWYLSTNMQLYVISVLFIVPLYRYPRLGVILVLVIASLGIFATGAVNYIYDIAPAMMFLTNPRLLDDVVIKIYHKPYSHVGGFCVGVMLGYLLKRRKNRQISLFVQAVIWLLALTLSVILLFGTYEWNRGALPKVLLSSVYAASHRTAWTLPIAWLVYVCVSGQAEFLNRLLSWSGFIPLSNLSYACYLVHPLVIIYNLGSRKERVYYDHYNMAYLFCGNFVLTIAVALVCCLVAEVPFSNLEKLIFRRRQNVDAKPTGFKEINKGKQDEIDVPNQNVNASNPNV